MRTEDIRSAFLRYFEQRGHRRLPGSSLVPEDDPSLLFTNAGMVQFKNIFLGQQEPPCARAVTAQCCVRAGGKHNDLEQVGYTARHHTLFEMLGNFSFGDYFKKQAIHYCWDWLVGHINLPPERLLVTVHRDDDEAAAIWTDDMGVPPERLLRLDADNFWQMGETGPCGPCSEVYYDHGPEVPGGLPGGDDEGDRYTEIWNLVFMQYQRHRDGSQTDLPRPSIDTGAGLERLAAVLQGVHSNYDTDLFRGLICAAADATGAAERSSRSLRVIADHIRSCAFLLMDGVVPGNEGRGYVLRRIIRRAVRHGHLLGARAPFLHSLMPALVAQMGAAWPRLQEHADAIEAAICDEERKFARTLERGLALLERAMAGSRGRISGQTIFQLHDTYGFPPDLTADIARERGLEMDMQGYGEQMRRQRQRARDASRFGAAAALALDGETEFCGYARSAGEALVLALLDEREQSVERLESGSGGAVVLDRTPFYAEGGGQVGDSGVLCGDAGDGIRFVVRDCRKKSGHHLHYGTLESGALSVGDRLGAQISEPRRRAIACNHSATHLLHAALRRSLGDGVCQRGSLVDADRLRFDFSHPQALGAEQLAALEADINAQIWANTEVAVREMSRDDAIKLGAIAIFGEKYGDWVRVLRMGRAADGGDYSVEFCGGTHVRRTGDMGLFVITAESGVASGIRRIEARTGEAAFAWLRGAERRAARAAAMLGVQPAHLPERVEKVLGEAQELRSKLGQARRQAMGGGDLARRAEQMGGLQVLLAAVEGADAKALQSMADGLRERLAPALVLLAAADGDRATLVATASGDAAGRVGADELLREVAAAMGGKGGGRAQFARGGGRAEHLEKALARGREFLQGRLQ